jgi:glycosyltransferase involved in cell wall biosynthesis
VNLTYEPFECDELHAAIYRPGELGRKITLVTKALGRRWQLMQSLKDFDLIYVFREVALLGPAFFERWISRSGVPMVFDFDDAIFVSYKSPSNGYLSYLKFASKAKTICRFSHHVMVGNPYLAQYASQFNSHVTVIPTTIDTEKYVPRHRSGNERLIIGWTGSHSTVQHLDTLRSALQKLAQRDRFKLRVIGSPTYSLPGVEVEAMQWRSDTELQDLDDIDIGVMPLPDDDWSKGKCGLKALQFMALGIPTMCSPVGVNTDIIRDSENGLIAATEDEWVEKLSLLLRSAELRKTLGDAGRTTVETRYSARIQAPRVFEIFESVLQPAKAPAALPKNAEPQSLSTNQR